MFRVAALSGRPISELLEMSLCQIQLLEEACVRTRAADRISELVMTQMAIASTFGGKEGGKACKDYVSDLTSLVNGKAKA